MTRDELIGTADAMRAFGGSFAVSIANAALHADDTNLKKLLAAFSELFAKYGPGSDYYRAPAKS